MDVLVWMMHLPSPFHFSLIRPFCMSHFHGQIQSVSEFCCMLCTYIPTYGACAQMLTTLK